MEAAGQKGALSSMPFEAQIPVEDWDIGSSRK